MVQQACNPCASCSRANKTYLFGEAVYATEACLGRAAGDDMAPVACVGDSTARGGGDAVRVGAALAHEKRAVLSLRSSACIDPPLAMGQLKHTAQLGKCATP